jgi:mercuric ion transport protein
VFWFQLWAVPHVSLLWPHLAHLPDLVFFSAYEGVFINKLLPLFAIIVLVSNLAAWVSHRNHIRMSWGLLGPLMVLATLYLFSTDNWSTYMFYTGLVLMLTISIWDIVSPPAKICALPEAGTFD